VWILTLWYVHSVKRRKNSPNICCLWVWSLCFSIRFLFVQHKSLKCHFENFYLVHLSIKQNQVWKEMWMAIGRYIWQQRNLVVFKQGFLIPNMEEIFHSAQLLSWLRLKHRVTFFNFAFSDLHLNPGQCLQSCWCRGRSNGLVVLGSDAFVWTGAVWFISRWPMQSRSL